MPNRSTLSPDQETQLRAAVQSGGSLRSTARSLGITHGKAQRFAQKIRSEDEFPKSIQTPVIAPRRETAITDWSLERIRAARDAQLRGDFKLAVRMAEAMRTDDAIYIARNNRIAAHAAVSAEIQARDDTTRALSVAGRAQLSIQTPRSVVSGIQATLVDHAVAIGQVIQETNKEGTVVSMRLEEWPLEHVRENPSTEVLETFTRNGGPRIPIVHGDGRWIIFRRKGIRPWAQDATLLPAALVWAIHTPALQNWAAAARSHGIAKVIGTLKEGEALQKADGTLTQEATMFLNMISDVVSGVAGAGLASFGAKVDFLSNDSTAWQIFTELVKDRERSAARIYNGTDAVLGSSGGAPGVDVSALFGVLTTILQGDFQAIEDGIMSGMVEPWTAINYGDSRLAPRWKYLLPDPDEQRKIDQTAARLERFLAIVKAWKAEGFIADQETIDRLAHSMGIDLCPKLPAAAPSPAPSPPDPTEPLPVARTPAPRAARGPAQERSERFDETKHPRRKDGKFGTGAPSPKKGRPAKREPIKLPKPIDPEAFAKKTDTFVAAHKRGDHLASRAASVEVRGDVRSALSGMGIKSDSLKNRGIHVENETSSFAWAYTDGRHAGLVGMRPSEVEALSQGHPRPKHNLIHEELHMSAQCDTANFTKHHAWVEEVSTESAALKIGHHLFGHDKPEITYDGKDVHLAGSFGSYKSDLTLAAYALSDVTGEDVNVSLNRIADAGIRMRHPGNKKRTYTEAFFDGLDISPAHAARFRKFVEKQHL